MFSPLSPVELIEKLEKEYQDYTSELKRELESFDLHSDFDPVWNLSEPEAVYDMAGRILAAARQTI